MTDSDRRIEKVAMFAANAGPIDDHRVFYAQMRDKVPSLTRSEFDRGFIRGANRLSDSVYARFGSPPGEHIPEGPLDHSDDEPS